MHAVYIIYSPSLNRFYIGESAKPDERITHHRSGDQRFTRRANDWILVFKKHVSDRPEALRIERLIKQAKSRKSIIRWIRQPDNLVDPAIWQAFAW